MPPQRFIPATDTPSQLSILKVLGSQNDQPSVNYFTNLGGAGGGLVTTFVLKYLAQLPPFTHIYPQ
jgi:hypothetical protein